jgi:hypothetical protein
MATLAAMRLNSLAALRLNSLALKEVEPCYQCQQPCNYCFHRNRLPLSGVPAAALRCFRRRDSGRQRYHTCDVVALVKFCNDVLVRLCDDVLVCWCSGRVLMDSGKVLVAQGWVRVDLHKVLAQRWC